MKNVQFKFHITYFLIASIFFFIEVYIALYIKTPFIRHFLGDVFVVILIYTFIKSFFNFSVKTTVIGVLIFSYLIEIFQYFKGIELLGLKDNFTARLIIGTTFTWSDLVAYALGCLFILITENMIKNRF